VSHEAGNREEKKMTNDRLRAEVAAELSWDPKVDGTDITVSVEGGRVTLHGTVTRFRQKQEADNAARHVHGVTDISNFVEVRIPDQDRRSDTDVRADVGQALALNDLIPATVQASVESGLVTLSGVAAGSRYPPTAHFPAWLFFPGPSAPGPNAMTPSPSLGPRRASPTSMTGSRSSTR
jgi:osmotically-inducible protein OsmY